MTTIVSNGYYLAADWAISTPIDPCLTQIDPTTLEKIDRSTGNFLKLRVLDGKSVRLKNAYEIGSIMGYASSGDAYLHSGIFEILSSVSVFDPFQWRSFLRGPGESAILMVTDTCHTVKININDSHMRMDVYFPGSIIVEGSGSNHCDLMMNELTNPKVSSIEAILAVASCVDEGTSREYSVLGVRENTFYPNVQPSKEHCINIAKKFWSKVGDSICAENID